MATLVNNRDFKKFSYDYETKEALEAFSVKKDQRRVNKDNVHKKIEYKTKEEIRKDVKENRFTIFLYMITFLIAFSCIVGGITFGVQSFEVKHELSQVETQVKLAQSETISLESELEKSASIGNIDTYAVQKMGMVRNRHDFKYIDSSKYKRIETREIN